MKTSGMSKKRVEDVLYVSPKMQLLFDLVKKHLPEWDEEKLRKNADEAWKLVFEVADQDDKPRINELFERGEYNTPPEEEVKRIDAPTDTQRILFTADFHMGGHRSSLQGFYETIEEENPGAVVIAGDLARPSRAGTQLTAIRKIVGKRPCAVALGNHDFWTGNVMGKNYHLMENVIDDFWTGPCRDNDLVLLDRQNALWGDVAIVGGYGHFDLGLAWPNLILDGEPVGEDIYLKGDGWNDFNYIPQCAEFLKVNARDQAAGVAKRLDQAIADKKRILVAMHTCPWSELNGHPRTGSYSDIFTGYSGNSKVGKEIKKRASNIEFLMCGHTHFAVKERKIHGIPSLNVGADYGVFRGVIYDTSKKTIKWVGETAF